MAEKQQILVVEDDNMIRETLTQQLNNMGYGVRSATNGNEAIPIIQGRAYDAIILDLKMPYIDGFGVLQFVKSTFPKTKVIILTAYDGIKNTEKCKELGADEIIGKPYDLEYLFFRLKEMLEVPFVPKRESPVA
jgi:two-component system response regulator PilR (NtrC family)